jgi:hypothetical protein
MCFFVRFGLFFGLMRFFFRIKECHVHKRVGPERSPRLGEENDCGIFFLREFFLIPKYKLSFCECGILAVYKTRSHFNNSYVCDALSKLIFAGELDVCGTSDEGASLHNPVSS